jgi:hypothetical protein
MSATSPDAAITGWLTMIRECCHSNGLPKEFTYAGIGDFLLQHGVWYQPRPLPKHIRRGLPRCCFGNALLLARSRRYRYVEGYAVPDIGVCLPMHHAWNLDRRGNLIDSTWDKPGLTYLGIEFPLDVAEDALRHNDCTVLDNPKAEHKLFRKPYVTP